jgi:8-oxo-dGTP pyrophosphatase MutT (NUDIX family)
MRTSERDIFSAMMFSRDGKILFGVPRVGGVYPHAWHLPGGGVDEGETKAQTLRREVQEEVGINIAPYKTTLLEDDLIGEAEKVLKDTGERVLCKMRFHDYKVSIDDKDASEMLVTLRSDLVAYRWIAPAELASIPLTPPSVALFNRLGYLKSMTV